MRFRRNGEENRIENLKSAQITMKMQGKSGNRPVHGLHQAAMDMHSHGLEPALSQHDCCKSRTRQPNGHSDPG